jgi:hypothetical protein
MEEHVITVTPTIGSGTVVRWYRTLQAATHNQPTLSSSRDGVLIHGSVYLHTIPVEWIAAANRAYGRLRSDRGADVSGMATHRRGGLSGPLERVAGGVVGA